MDLLLQKATFAILFIPYDSWDWKSTKAGDVSETFHFSFEDCWKDFTFLVFHMLLCEGRDFAVSYGPWKHLSRIECLKQPVCWQQEELDERVPTAVRTLITPYYVICFHI